MNVIDKNNLGSPLRQTNAAQEAGFAAGVRQKNINSLVKGDSFTATVKDITPNGIVLQLKDGSELNARAQIALDAHIGDDAIFMVKENFKGQILLELVKQDPTNRQTAVLREALEGAGMPVTDENRSIVRALMENGSPIDAQTLRKAAFFKYSDSNIDLDKMIFLINENLPASEKTISAFAAVTGKAGNEKTGFSKLGDDLAMVLKELFFEQEVEILGADAATDNITGSKAEDKQKTIGKAFDKEGLARDIAGLILRRSGIDTENVDVMKYIAEMSGDEGEVSEGGEFSELNDETAVLERSDGKMKLIEIASKMLKQKFFADLELIMRDGTEMTKFFKELADVTEEVKNIAAKYMGSSESGKNTENKIAEKLDNILNNLEFMSKIQNTKEYFQIPFTLNGEENTGEIHVFKDAGKKKDLGSSASVLVVMDYITLGHVEIFINKNFNSLSFQFKAEEDAALRVIGQNAYNLTRILNEKGYQVTQIAYRQSKEKFDASMVPEGLKPKREQPKRYSFDIRI